jgi:predicted neuraminidase
MAQRSKPQPFFETRIIFPADGGRFRVNAYPTVAALPEGRLFLTWSASDQKKPRIVGAFSSDGGKTWSAPEDLIDTPNRGDYDPNIIVAKDEIQVYSTTTPEPQKVIDISETWKVSRQFNGSAWTKPERMPQHRKYLVGKIHVGLTLPDGTLVMPYSWDVPAEEGRPVSTEGTMKLKSGVLLSRDNGKTWTAGGDMFVEPPRTSDFGTGGVCEPSMVLLENGEIFALLRTSDVWHYESRSRDGGKTWDVPKPSPLQGHNTPAALCRLKGSRDVLVVWNNSPRHRSPLDVALSQDNGKTWSPPKTLASPVGVQASYPSAAQAADGTLVVVWQQDREDRKGRDLHIARFNRAWLLTQQAASQPKLIAQFDESPLIIQIPGGQLMAIFMRGLNVTARSSADNGISWGEEKSLFTLPPDPGAWGGLEALVDRDGEMHLFFLNDAKTSRLPMAQRHLDIWHVKSSGGRTRWQPPQRIWEGYTGALNSVIQIRSGRILLPFSYYTKRTWFNRKELPDAFTFMGHYDSTLVYSDDAGATWHLAQTPLKVPAPDITSDESGAVEPVVIELKDGRVWMLIRTQRGRLYESFSKDGATWSQPQPSRFISSESPPGLVRLPDGRIVLFWNCCQRFPYAYGGRHALHAAISEDEGQTWRGFREVVRDPRRHEPPPLGGDFGTAYPFPTATPNGKVIFTTGQGEGRRVNVLLDPAWLYETTQRDDFSAGLDEWSVFGTKGVELVSHPHKVGARVLHVRKADADWSAAAVRNFPIGAKGKLRLRLMLKPGFDGALVSLTDHFSAPFDEEDKFFNLFNLRLGADVQLTPNRWHVIELNWDCAKRRCRVSVDGKQAVVLPQLRESDGACYLRLRSTSEQADEGGFIVESVEVGVSPSYSSTRRK